MTSWTPVADGSIDQDSPVSEDLMEDLRDNDKHIRERQARYGTDATGVRYVVAQGTKTFSLTHSGGVDKAADIVITFSSDADDGDPNFSAAPTIAVLTLEEDTTGSGVAWALTTEFHQVHAFIKNGTISQTAMTIKVHAHASGGSNDVVDGKVHWRVYGAPTGTE